MTKIKIICMGAGVLAGACLASAEVPGEFRPQPVLHPLEWVGARGTNVQPLNTYPVSRAPLVNTAQRKPKLANPCAPKLRGNELLFNSGWEMIEAPRLKNADGAVLSKPGVDTRDWYDATVPGTVLTTLVNEGVYPDPYYGLNNLLIPESLNQQDYWYRTEFTVPKNFAGRELTLQFNGINYYAEVWFNGEYLGHITGAFIRGKFDVTKLANARRAECDRRHGCAAAGSRTFRASNPSNTVPATTVAKCVSTVRALNAPKAGTGFLPFATATRGIWQDVVLRATGPVTIGDSQVITILPLPDTSRADVTVKAELHNASDVVQIGVSSGEFARRSESIFSVPWG